MTVFASSVPSIDPRSCEVLAQVPVSTQDEVGRVVGRAGQVAAAVSNAAPDTRATWLEALADAVEARAEELGDIADRETGLGRARLDGEVLRCATQLRFYASVARNGAWLEATIDHATNAVPDIRRVRRALGPVAVFAASNFPFAFGTLGHDTGSAIAAGCPVVVKGHPAHPQTHRLLSEIAAKALADVGAPVGLFGEVTGFEAGNALVVHPSIAAVGFTGSQQGGLALWSLASTRRVVIPVFAEMGTVNPVVVTRRGADDAEGVAAGCVGSFTLGMGQFCTKPGLLLVPAGSDMASALATALRQAAPRGPLLTAGMATAYVAALDRLVAAGASVIGDVPDPGAGTAVSAVVLSAPSSALNPDSPLLEECFGPVIVVVEYSDDTERDVVLGQLQGCLVASVIAEPGGDDLEVGPLVARLESHAGRVTVNSWPTGVATTWAQHHGGPWPATTSPAATSVGAAALQRFTRPVAYQGLPAQALSPALREENEWSIPRRVDGAMSLPRGPQDAS